MSKAQPGSGYGFTSSGYGFTLNTEKPFNEPEATPETCLPLKAKYDSYDAVGNSHFFTVCVGMVNNLIPQMLIDTETWAKLDRVTEGEPDPPVSVLNVTSGQGVIYLRCGNTAGPPAAYPATDDTTAGYPRIISAGGAVPSDTDTYSYILLARVLIDAEEKATITPVVQSSLWTERFKCGSGGASYWWSAI